MELPETRAARIAELAQLPALLEALVVPLAEAQLDAHAAHDPWTIRQIVHHLADSHMNSFVRMRLMLTEEHPTLKPYNQDAWSLLPDARAPISESLALLHGLHARWAAMLSGLPEAAWDRPGHHPEAGTVTIGGMLESYVRHGHEHLAQIGRILSATGTVRLPEIPFPLYWAIAPQRWEYADGVLTATAGGQTDLFIDPQGSAPKLNAPHLVGEVHGDFMLSAHVTVDFAADFDAGALIVWAGDHVWAKLCFEYSPQREPMVVSVVTRGISDDANGFTIAQHSIWLRVSRRGRALAFPASTDGRAWQMIRHFALDLPPGVSLGLLAQSPSGNGCRVQFAQIVFAAQRLAALRTGE
ncbi:MAG TPA: DUF1349 domain-containing protein [Roseiflexaceae bacterium]|nr:DUF1349 domain-containing protein [Roseiflexaceae bacterium]